MPQHRHAPERNIKPFKFSNVICTRFLSRAADLNCYRQLLEIADRSLEKNSQGQRIGERPSVLRLKLLAPLYQTSSLLIMAIKSDMQVYY